MSIFGVCGMSKGYIPLTQIIGTNWWKLELRNDLPCISAGYGSRIYPKITSVVRTLSYMLLQQSPLRFKQTGSE